jgi:hypothetical protein
LNGLWRKRCVEGVRVVATRICTGLRLHSPAVGYAQGLVWHPIWVALYGMFSMLEKMEVYK